MIQFLSGRKQRVKVFGDNGQEFFSEVDSGVPQGTILGPTQFNIFINDASEGVTNKMNPYADNSEFISSTESSITRVFVQEDLNLISQWSC